ncbi:hypothetical protein HNR19_000329 [Nocardioides thalensis]|uniref:Uncharacterized protein n=1 Tax=Nocardioides thalensis TaxID=1914755 RepID=A0A853BXD9_9ACTN|nr:hypothetical protein [Nocardioides thalensis]NYI99630.1 hypothetical protein [Nocardioides thalensis]
MIAGGVLVAGRITPDPDLLPVARDSISRFAAWVLAATTDAQFHLSALGGGLMVAGALVAHELGRRNRRVAGFPIACGTGRLPTVLLASTASLALGSALWGWTADATGAWQPLFVSFVSVPAAVVLTYGVRPRAVVTGVLAGVVLTTPIALLVHSVLCIPLGLPGVVSATTGMWASAIITFLVSDRTGWLQRDLGNRVPGPDAASMGAVQWSVRRTLADFTEPQFYGNEWAGAGMILGLLVAAAVDPALAVYGSGLWAHVLLSQIATALLATTMWRSSWREHGWYPTFTPLVSFVPALVLAEGGSVLADGVAVVVGATVVPPLAFALGRRMPDGVHPFAGYVMAMTISCAALVPVLTALPMERV